MTTQSNQTIVEKKKINGGLVGGMVLILVGLLALVQQFVKVDWFGMAFLPGLALIFIAAGLVRNQIGFIIPGGILAGIGTGVIVESRLQMPELQEGGTMLLIFAAGWVLITLLSFVLHARDARQEVAWWALIPAGIMGLIGAAILMGGTALKALEVVGKGWPVILIAIGLYIMLRRKQIQEN